MKFTAEVSALRRAADAACPAALSKGVIPLLACVRISARENLRLIGTDMDMEVSAACEAVVTKTGNTCVDAGSFRSFVASLPAGAQIEGETTEHNLILRAGRARAHFKMLDPADFPAPTSERETTHRFVLSAKELGRALGRVSWAVSNEERRYYLKGVFVHRDADNLIFVTTNGHVLSRTATAAPEGTASIPAVIIPNPALAALSKLLRGADDECAIELSDALARFTLGATALTTKLIDGTFPDYNRVIPADPGAPVQIPRKPLLEALSRAMIAAERNKDGRAVRLNFDGDALTITAKDEHGDISDGMDAMASVPLEIGFNGLYLRAALECIGSESVELLAKPGYPAILHGENDGPLDTIVIMPMRI